MSSFFAYLNRMKYIKRWSLMRSYEPENILEHSAEVSMIAHALAVIGNKYYGKSYNCDRIGMVALYHETSEVITGDLPTPIKYFNPEIKNAFKDLEKGAEDKLLNTLPESLRDVYQELVRPSQEEYTIMKYADKISAYIKCVEELKAGNKEFAKAEKSIKKDIENFNSEEVNYFMKNFFPSFKKTLDELEL